MIPDPVPWLGWVCRAFGRVRQVLGNLVSGTPQRGSERMSAQFIEMQLSRRGHRFYPQNPTPGLYETDEVRGAVRGFS